MMSKPVTHHYKSRIVRSNKAIHALAHLQTIAVMILLLTLGYYGWITRDVFDAGPFGRGLLISLTYLILYIVFIKVTDRLHGRVKGSVTFDGAMIRHGGAAFETSKSRGFAVQSGQKGSMQGSLPIVQIMHQLDDAAVALPGEWYPDHQIEAVNLVQRLNRILQEQKPTQLPDDRDGFALGPKMPTE